MVRPLSINDKLHLVIPIVDDNDSVTGYVHSAPISREVFEAHFELVAATFTAIFGGGHNILGGPRIAALMLRKVSEKSSSDPGEALDLMNEIRRLTNVIIRGPQGWTSSSFQDAVDHRELSDDDIAEVTNAIVFFTVTSAMQPKKRLKSMMGLVSEVWGARTSYSDCTAFIASLATSTNDAPTTLNPIPASSVVF